MIYLDNNATTSVNPQVLDEMLPYFSEKYGNPSSSHLIGREAKKAIGTARSRIAQFINTDDDSIIFTGSGTEANNLAIFGLYAKFSENESNGRNASVAQWGRGYNTRGEY